MSACRKYQIQGIDIWSAICILIFIAISTSLIYPLLVIFPFSCMLIICLGHECCHSSLFSSVSNIKTRKLLNNIFGTVSYALIGLNFQFIKTSHAQHHACGLKHDHCRLDGSRFNDTTLNSILYYLFLAGLGFILIMLAPIYELFPKKRGPHKRQSKLLQYRLVYNQILVIAAHLTAIFFLTWYYFACLLIVAITWGVTQNVAHYRVVSNSEHLASIAARTYIVHPALEFMFFGSYFRHLAHHYRPNIPGVDLRRSNIESIIEGTHSVTVLRRHGMPALLSDILWQIQGPNAKLKPSKDWLKR